MQLRGLRIGYIPSSTGFTAPSDRRRFVYYAQKRDLPFEVAEPSREYDVVVVTQRADLSIWHRYRPGKAKIVYDAIDSYLSIPRWDPKAQLRGLSKFVTRQSRYLQLNYHKAIEKMCLRADAVVCSTEEQRKRLLSLCDNVHMILDLHTNDVLSVKTDYSCGEVINFAWEGLASSQIPMALLRRILEPVARERKVALHLLTDLVYYRYHDLYMKRSTPDEARRVFKGFPGNVYLYQWNSQMFSRIVSACDLALIPIPLNDALRRGRPENKLVLLWRTGVPVIVSATPSYERVMQQCGLPMACTTLEDWHTTIERYAKDQSAREHAGQTGRCFAEENYSEEVILKRWDNLFHSLWATRSDAETQATQQVLQPGNRRNAGLLRQGKT